MRSEYTANIKLESLESKVKRLMNSQLPYAVRLAAVIASDTNKGKKW